MKKKGLILVYLLCATITLHAQKFGDYVPPIRGAGYPEITENTKIVYTDRSSAYSTLTTNATDFSDGVALYEDPRSRMWGIIDTAGNILLKPTITLGIAEPEPRFYKGRAAINAKDREGIWMINKKGETVAKWPHIKTVPHFVNGYAGVIFQDYAGKKMSGYINTEGKVVFPKLTQGYQGFASVPTMRYFKDDMCPYKCLKSNQWGFFNSKGEIVITAQYQDVLEFSEGLCGVKDGDKWGFINTKGETVLNFIYSKKPTSFSNGYAIVYRLSDRMYCFIDTTGAIKYSANNVINFSKEGIAIIDKGGKTYMINPNLEVVKRLGQLDLTDSYHKNTAQFEECSDFWVLRPSNFNSHIVTDHNLKPIFWSYSLNAFHDGLSYIIFDDPNDTQNRQSGYVNKKGEIVILFKANEF